MKFGPVKFGDGKLASPGAVRKFGGYAYFPGTGPKGETCARCVHKLDQPGKRVVCMKWKALMRFRGHPKSMPKIESGAPACKYFEKIGAATGSAAGQPAQKTMAEIFGWDK